MSMILRKWLTSKNSLLFGSVMLAGYLLLILTVTNVGQKKLQESQHNELHLKIQHYANLLSNYFELSNRSLSFIARNKTISTFYANKNSGMSMTYGLRASLFNVQQLLAERIEPNQDKRPPYFSRITLLALDGTIIADTAQQTGFNRGNIDLSALKSVDQKLLINKYQNQLSLRLSTTVYFQNKPIAMMIGEYNQSPIIALLDAQQYQGTGSYIRLLSEYGSIFIWDSLNNPEDFDLDNDHDDHLHSFHLNKKVENTSFTLEAWVEGVDNKSLFTSKWFVLLLSLLAVPVFSSLYYLFYIERKNSLLRAQIHHSTKQQTVLSTHNLQLEKEVSKRKLSEEKLAFQATHDSLTGLPNRSYSLQKLNDAVNNCQRSRKKVLIMYIDLDNFKQVNDTLGHAAGDIILQETGKRLKLALRKTDTVARLSGDEFMVIIDELQDLEQAKELAVKVLHLFDQPFKMNKHLFHTSTSIGLAVFPDDATDAENLLKSADMALYKVKETGRNNFSFFESKMNDDVNRKVAINVRLRAALKENTLEMYYQPLIDLSTQKIIGAEALMRWTDSQLGFVPPDEFIAQAEKNDLIDQLGSFALNTAAHQAAEWQKIAPLQIAINFSSVQFRHCESLLAEIQEVLLTTGLPPEKLDVEVTESLLINQEGELFDMLKSLRNMGVELSIDDFGTGYSALSYLQKFSFTKLKIDRAFIMNLTNNRADQSLVKAITAMAKALNLKVVAEGIEDKKQMQFLTGLDCEFGQGYFFSPPVTAEKFERLLRDQISAES
ncbi:bifunctional diguanylate cyclase/phosphodiesterase [Psychromonas sp. SR45-3]|uniref:putative bifunctional diguanylate cyclase/phosphodiesterase n=1 Tax=Psychromonas sp. SR45-3 TaxID=2760930 RepID=UPI00217581F9|nr:EAL domain-containing protein [Psychromonas sp. SR45-3]